MTNFEKYKEELTLSKFVDSMILNCDVCPVYPCRDELHDVGDECSKELFGWCGEEHTPPEEEVEMCCKNCKNRPEKTADYDDEPNGFNLTFSGDHRCVCHVDGDEYYSWYPEDDFYCRKFSQRR